MTNKVKAWQEKITLPTYLPGAEDPNPSFFGSAWVYGRNYPYPNQDVITRKKIDKEYDAVYLENEYLKILVVPETGSRVWSLYDKLKKREVWYRNHVVKPAEVGARGAWISGGNELNFPANPPNEHSVSCFAPVDYELRQNEGGSASIIIGDQEKIQEMQWIVHLTLYPGKAYLEQEAILFNPTESRKIYIWYANATVPDEPDLEFIYPARNAYSAPGTIIPYPWDEGVDKSKAKNIHHAQSIFVRGVRRDFFGAYFSKTEHGVVHIADYHEVEGKKIWHWGQSDDGKRWINILTDPPNGQYAEIQSGRSVAEWEYEFLQPYRINHLMEYWYPVRDIGSFVFANKQLTLNFKKTTIDDGEIAKIELALFATERLQEIIVKVFRNHENIIFQKKINISPESAFRQKMQAESEGTFQVQILSGENILLNYDSCEPIDNNPTNKEEDEKDPTIDKYGLKSAEILSLAGSELEKFKYNIPKAREMNNKALEIDPGYSHALLNLGILDIKAGLFTDAQDKLYRARLRNPEDVFINYYLGVVYMNLGNYEAAEDHLWVGVRHYDFVPSLFELGRLEIIRQKYTVAIEYLNKVLRLEPLNFKAATFLSVCLRKLKMNDGAEKIIRDHIEKAPLDYLLNAEYFQLTKNQVARERLFKFFRRDSDTVITISMEYMKLGLFNESIVLLKLYIESETEVKNPMIYYYLSFAYGKMNEEVKAGKFNELGNTLNYAYVFPFHNYSINVLKYALQLSPQTGRIHYYLGNLYFHKYRYEEGITEWKYAVKMENIAVAHRNLALAYHRLYNDLDNSEKEYKTAIQLNPHDFRYYCDLYEINMLQGKVDEIYDLFLSAPKAIFTHGRFLTRLAIMHLIKNKVDEAIQILTGNEFFVMEGESNIHDIHITAYLLKGIALIHNKQYQQALESFQESALYPENHNVGHPEFATFAKINFFIGLSYYLQGENEKATDFFQKSAGEKVKPMTYMNLVFGTEPEPYSEADFYKIMSLEILDKKEEMKKLLHDFETYVDQLIEDSNGFYLRELLNKLKGRNAEANLLYRNSQKKQSDHLESLVAVQIPESWIHLP